MNNPTVLQTAIVAKLRAIAPLVTLLGGVEASITGHGDQGAIYRTQDEAIVNMQESTLMVVYLGMQLAYLDGVQLFRHAWGLILRAPEISPAGDGPAYLQFPALVLSGVPDDGQGLEFQFGTIHDDYYPPNDFQFTRGVDKEGIEFWQFSFTCFEVSP